MLYLCPVSYTHLNVLLREAYRTIQNILHSPRPVWLVLRHIHVRGSSAVSYTHLDVYKRQASTAV